MRQLLDVLNPEQREAVTTTEGPLLVLAGAGTGKTRVITYRIAWLLARGLRPENVLAVTFTNKAAGEMRERVAALVGEAQAEGLTIGTFHAFCLARLREHRERAGLGRGFTICDAGDQLATFKGVLRELHVAEARLRPQALQAQVSLLKNRLVDPAAFLARAADPEEELVGRAWLRYEESLAATRRLDFDDLLLRMVALLGEHADLRREHQERFRYVLVDEYQDTNQPQYEIVRRIAEEHRNLCVVGDDDQSIYGWRGADVTKILGFERDFPGARVVRLETNYRSTRNILAVANRLIEHNHGRHGKVLRSAIGGGENVQAVLMRDESYEAEHVVAEIQRLVAAEQALWSDFAILFRTATQPRAFEAELRMKQVPYVLVGGMSFFDRKEVRDVLAWLKLVVNPDDEVSLLRVVNVPPRGVGKTRVARALEFATREGIGAAEAFERGAEIEGVGADTAAVVTRLRGRLAALGKLRGQGLVALVERVLEEVAYRSEVERCYPDERERAQRWEAVTEILNFAENHAARRKRARLETFVQELCLSAGDAPAAEDAGRRNSVTLMTLHASKGLEYPRVYLVGMEEGLLPHARSVVEDRIEEERRLAYVGVTRAQHVLTLTHCNERARYGTRVQCHPSRFLLEIKGTPPPEGWRAAGSDEPRDSRGKKPRGRKKAARKKAAKKTAGRAADGAGK